MDIFETLACETESLDDRERNAAFGLRVVRTAVITVLLMNLSSPLAGADQKMDAAVADMKAKLQSGGFPADVFTQNQERVDAIQVNTTPVEFQKLAQHFQSILNTDGLASSVSADASHRQRLCEVTTEYRQPPHRFNPFESVLQFLRDHQCEN